MIDNQDPFGQIENHETGLWEYKIKQNFWNSKLFAKDYERLRNLRRYQFSEFQAAWCFQFYSQLGQKTC